MNFLKIFAFPFIRFESSIFSLSSFSLSPTPPYLSSLLLLSCQVRRRIALRKQPVREAISEGKSAVTYKAKEGTYRVPSGAEAVRLIQSLDGAPLSTSLTFSYLHGSRIPLSP